MQTQRTPAGSGWETPVDERTAAKFWAKVDQRGPDECWPWRGQCEHHGYGILWVGTTAQNRRRALAHRISASLAGLDLATGLEVMHSCDNPPCVNPAHLKLGTHAENMADCKARGRVGYVLPPQPRGEANPRHKLSNADVLAIRELSATKSQRALADEFEVSPSLVSRIIRGQRRTEKP